MSSPRTWKRKLVDVRQKAVFIHKSGTSFCKKGCVCLHVKSTFLHAVYPRAVVSVKKEISNEHRGTFILWSPCSRVLLNIPRTTNRVEGWHRSINQDYISHHPNTARFIEVGQKDEMRFEFIQVDYQKRSKVKRNRWKRMKNLLIPWRQSIIGVWKIKI